MDVTIRPLMPHEAHAMSTLANEFYAEGDLPGMLDEQRFLSIWEMWLSQGSGLVIGAWHGEQLVGAIGGLFSFSPMTGDLELNEMFWFVGREARKAGVGLDLLDRFEQEARGHQADRVTMVHLANGVGQKVGELLKGRGYAPLEVHYRLEL